MDGLAPEWARYDDRDLSLYTVVLFYPKKTSKYRFVESAALRDSVAESSNLAKGVFGSPV